MNILIANNSFKDVFSPIQLAEIIRKSVDISDNCITSPTCDGGEYTADVLSYYFKPEKIYVDNVIGPYGEKRRVCYLVHEKSAYIISSEIIRLLPHESDKKNPLYLTDYGFGQLIRDAITKGYKKIYICLGGTSTVCYGMGVAQALGANLYDIYNHIITEPITPSRFCDIDRFEYDKNKYEGIEIIVINDSDTKAYEMDYASRLKIGGKYSDQEADIMNKLHVAGERVYCLTKRTPFDNFSGNAGGVYYGLEMVLKPSYVRGTTFFIDLLDIEKKIIDADVVITGEGKFDCVEVSKMPVSIIKLCSYYRKPVILIAGQIDENLSHSNLMRLGITEYICCQEHYTKQISSLLTEPYIDAIEYYKANTPIIISKYLKNVLAKISTMR